MDAGQHQHLRHHHQIQQQQILLSNTTTTSSVNILGGDTSGGGDRFPQWSIEETRDFVMIRAELDPTFMETKRNKVLWQLIATKMKDKGYHRSAEQCKCKWKNLVTRYKGCETMEVPEGIMKQQFPFYNELQTIFAARMQRMLWNEAEGSGAGGGGGGSNKKKNAQLSSDDDEEEEDESDGDGDHKAGTSGVKKKRKTSKHTVGSTSINTTTTNVGSADVYKNVKEMLEDFMKQQIQMEMQWMKAYEAREEERRIREMEWRKKMEALEKERMAMERRWREREEQTRVREEARAEKRDALINALLNKLRREDSNIS